MSFWSFSRETKIRFAFILLFGLIPYRILGIFGIPFLWKIFMGISFLILFYIVLEEVVPYLLNFHLTQLFFFCCLQVEEYLCTAKLVYAVIFSSTIPLIYTLLAGNSSDPYFFYFLLFFLINLYYRLKEVFLNPKFAGSIYFEREAQIEQNDSSFTWDFIVYNMSAISKSLFKVPVENRLGFSMSQKAFPYIAKRYVFKQIYQAVKGNPEIVGAVSASATVFGIVYSEQKNTQRHKETLQLARETSEATVRAQEKMARAQIESAKATDNLARAQFEANQLKLKEFELRQKELPLLRPRNPDEKITDLFFSSFFKEIPYLI